jgi:hypothetical protein
MKFDYRLEQWGSTVLFQVLEMDESLRSKTGDGVVLFEHEGFCIRSVNVAELFDSNIYIRGFHRSKDYRVGLYNFDTVEEATEYFRKVKSVLEAFKKSLEVIVIKDDMFGKYVWGEYSAFAATCSTHVGYHIQKGGGVIYSMYVSDNLTHGIPKKLAQKQLNEVCLELNIPFKFEFVKEDVLNEK